MIVTIVHVYVKPENINDFIQATIKNHNNSVMEHGNLRFDFLQDSENKTKFVLYEAYEDQAAAAAHKKTTNYLEWREADASWMAQPRKGVKYKGIYP